MAEQTVCVAAVDPGTSNIAGWCGEVNLSSGMVKTFTMYKGTPRTKSQTVCSLSAECAIQIAEICAKHAPSHIVVETAPVWNMAARISASTVYGVLRGRNFDCVQFSSPVTKAKAIAFFAGKLGITDQLEKIPKELDRMDKKDSAKARLINKRNAVRVVQALLEFSSDSEGYRAMALCTKKDDMADALLLACGAALPPPPPKTKYVSKPRPSSTRQKTVKVPYVGDDNDLAKSQKLRKKAVPRVKKSGTAVVSRIKPIDSDTESDTDEDIDMIV